MLEIKRWCTTNNEDDATKWFHISYVDVEKLQNETGQWVLDSQDKNTFYQPICEDKEILLTSLKLAWTQRWKKT